jgi:transcriptional regulator with XRE-family HTH domain
MRGERIKQAREELGFTQDDLAEKLDVAVLQINRYENGKTEPNGEMVRKIALALNVSADYLLGMSDHPTPPSLSAGLSAEERAVLSAMRRGERLEAIKIISNE